MRYLLGVPHLPVLSYLSRSRSELHNDLHDNNYGHNRVLISKPILYIGTDAAYALAFLHRLPDTGIGKASLD